MKKVFFAATLLAGVGIAVALATPQGRAFVKKYTDEFTRNYKNQEDKLYEIFALTEEEIMEAKARKNTAN